MVDTSDEGNFRKAKNTCFRLLKIRLRSEQELRDKLSAKNHPILIAEQTIRYFKDCELIDDRLFARQWTSSRLKKPFGFGRIRLELQKKGIEAAIIDEALTEAGHQYDELAVVMPLAKHRATKYGNVSPEKIRQRVYGYLSRRGFNTNTIMKAIKNI
jgi:regulatory protein